MATVVSHTLRASGGDYTSIAGWLVGQARDLVTADEIAELVAYDDWATGLAEDSIITGFTVDATRYINLTVADGHRHTGIPQTGFFISANSGGNTTPMLEINNNYTRISWWDVENTRSAGAASSAIRYDGTTYGQIQSCIFASASSSCGAVWLNSTDFNSSTYPLVFTTLIWKSGGDGFYSSDAARRRYKLYNCVASGCSGTGIASGATNSPIVSNCVSYNNATDFGAGGYATGSDYNASGDTTASTYFTNNVTSVASTDFNDSANDDFHLSGATSTLNEAGADQSSLFTTDVDGDTWATTWSIGFDQIAISGGSTAALTTSASTSAIGTAGVAVTVALTGILATGLVGNLTNEQSVNLTSNTSTVTVESVSNSTTIALTGNASTPEVGSVSAGSDVEATATGVESTSSVGTVNDGIAPKYNTGQFIPSVEGQVITSGSEHYFGFSNATNHTSFSNIGDMPDGISIGYFAAGLFTYTGTLSNISSGVHNMQMSVTTPFGTATSDVIQWTVRDLVEVALTGNETTVSVGDPGVETSVAATGNESTSAVGVLSVLVANEAALTGESAAFDAGTILIEKAVALTGNASTSEVGTVTPSVGADIALTGVETTLSEGSVDYTKSGSVALTGSESTSGVGGLGVTGDGSASATGSESITSVDNVTASVSVALNGAQAAGEVGSIDKANSVNLAGTDAIVSAGNIAVQGTEQDTPLSRILLVVSETRTEIVVQETRVELITGES